MPPNLLHLIDVDEPWEMGFWSAQFGVSIPQLALAIGAVGTSALDLEKYFQELEQHSPARRTNEAPTPRHIRK